MNSAEEILQTREMLQVAKFRNRAKFRKPGNFYYAAKALPSATSAKQRKKFMRVYK